MEARYGFSLNKDLEEFNRFIETVKVLEFDHDMTSFEDVLNCPQLEKIVLGKNRYLYPDTLYSRSGDGSELYDPARSLRILEVANKLRRLNIELYGNHYFGGSIPTYVTRVADYPSIPKLNYIPAEAVDTVRSSVKDPEADVLLRNLVDNNPRTQWQSSPEPDIVRSYDLTIELKDVTTIQGIKISQLLFDPVTDTQSSKFLPSRLIVKTSTDAAIWKNVTFVEENKIGKGSGEVTLLPISEGKRDVKYIRITLNDEANGRLRSVKLGDIIPYY